MAHPTGLRYASPRQTGALFHVFVDCGFDIWRLSGRIVGKDRRMCQQVNSRIKDNRYGRTK